MLLFQEGQASQQCPLPHQQLSGGPAQHIGRSRVRRGSSSLQSRASRSSRADFITCAAQAWTTGCRVAGSGSSVPAAVLTNKDLEKLVDTNDEWIRVRTGIQKRHILGENESLSLHSARAAQSAMDMANVTADQVDLVLLATSSPDDIFGSAGQVTEACSARTRYLKVAEACRPAWTTRPESCAVSHRSKHCWAPSRLLHLTSQLHAAALWLP